MFVDKRGKQKEIELDEEDHLTVEDFKPQVDEESEDMEFEDSAYEMGEEDVEEDIDDKEEEDIEREEDIGDMEKEFIEVENKAQDATILEDTNVHFLKRRITFLQVQMEDMEKAL